MSKLLATALGLTAASFIVAAAPAAAVVYSVSLSGTLDSSTLNGTDTGAAGSAFSATLRFDTDDLPLNGDVDPAFFYTGTFFTLTALTLSNDAGLDFSAAVVGDDLTGQFGTAGEGGYAYLRQNRDSTSIVGGITTQILSSFILNGFDGVLRTAGSGLPDFSSLGGATLELSSSVSQNDANGNQLPGERMAVASGTITSITQAAVPEPATWATMMLGFGLVGAAMRRRTAALA